MKTAMLYPDRAGTLIVVGDTVELDGRMFDVEINPHNGELIIDGETGAESLANVHRKCLVIGHPYHAFDGQQFFIFDPTDLHNKTLKMIISEHNGIINVCGLDEQADKIYYITTLMRKEDTQ